MVKIIIRKAQNSDVHGIYLLGQKIQELNFSKKWHFHELSEIKEFIKFKKENVFLIAIEDKRIVGFVYAKILSHHAGGWCMLDNLAVEKHERQQGIGSELLHELYLELKKRKVKYVQVLEEIHHKKTRSFWKSKGYRETKTFVWAEKIIN